MLSELEEADTDIDQTMTSLPASALIYLQCHLLLGQWMMTLHQVPSTPTAA
jgi:hypothetical protein